MSSFVGDDDENSGSSHSTKLEAFWTPRQGSVHLVIPNQTARGNSASLWFQQEIMHYMEAQKDLATSIKSIGSKVNSYFWRLSGDEPNSLCKLLSMQEEELKVILHLCQIYFGQNNKFNKNTFF